MTWRIPGLSDHFIEFNDDLMLTVPVQPQDFFTQEGKVICYAQKNSMHLTRLTRWFKPAKFGIKSVTTKGSHMNGALLAGSRFWFLRLAHCQKAIRRDFYQKYFSGKFACFNNVDLATLEQIKMLIRWIELRQGVSFD